jgi:hypothetical protein
MRKTATILIALIVYSNGIAQKTTKSTTESLLKELAENSCKCIDSISVYNRATDQVAKEISNCIDEQSGALQLGKKLLSIEDAITNKKDKEGKKQIDISINTNENSQEYKQS